MALRKIPLSEAMDLPLGFSISDEDLEKGLSGIEPFLREHGWRGNDQPIAASASTKWTRKKRMERLQQLEASLLNTSNSDVRKSIREEIADLRSDKWTSDKVYGS